MKMSTKPELANNTWKKLSNIVSSGYIRALQVQDLTASSSKVCSNIFAYKFLDKYVIYDLQMLTMQYEPETYELLYLMHIVDQSFC